MTKCCRGLCVSTDLQGHTMSSHLEAIDDNLWMGPIAFPPKSRDNP